MIIRRLFASALLSAFAFIPFVSAQSTGKEKIVKVGDTAPDFQMQGSDGKTYKLSDFKGKQGVVLAWYPKAFTGG